MSIYSLASGEKIFYIFDGIPTKPLLCLIHGYGSDHTTFDSLIPYLIDNFYILRWDHRGHGQSTFNNTGSYDDLVENFSISKLALDAHELLIGLHLLDRDLFFYGHSLGGMVLQQFVCYFPNVCKGVVLGSTFPGAKLEQLTQRLNDYKSQKVLFNEEHFLESAHQGYSADFLQKHPEIITMELRRKSRVDPQVHLAIYENVALHYNVQEELPKLKIPILILHGDKDQTIPSEFAYLLHKLLPNSKLVIYPNLSHGINYEIPQLVVTDITEFLEPIVLK
jgi:pimeloyl-ACP methyl ester carboxylesterase